MAYRLAQGISIKSTPQGAFLVSLRPLRTVKLNDSLLKLIQPMTTETVMPQSDAEKAILQKLHRGGFIECVQDDLGVLPGLPSVSIIIPVKDRAEDLSQCLLSLHKLNYPDDRLQIIVVDDGSTDETPEVARQLGALVLSSGTTGGGPALARNRGAAAASGDILAFIDSDCTAAPDWLNDLLPAFADERLAAVGGWVDGMHHESALDRYEAVMSSLNLGRRDMVGDSGADTFYLPSCNLLVRQSAFAAAGGFRTELHVGEDVDLTWRLRDKGWKIRYLPRGVVFHAHRSRLWPFMRRRFDYGTSEGLLQQLHPRRGKKMPLPWALAVILFFAASAIVSLSVLFLIPAILLLLADGLVLRRKLASQGLSLGLGTLIAARVRACGSLAYYLGYHLLRYYLALFLTLSILYPPLSVVLLLVLLGVGMVDHQVRRAQLSLPQFYFYYFLEQLAYGCGVFRGCWKIKSFTSYRLDFGKVKLSA